MRQLTDPSRHHRPPPLQPHASYAGTVIWLLASCAIEPCADTGLSAGTCAQELEATDLGGAAWRLSEQRGDVVLVSFVAGWCIDCQDASAEQAVLDRYRAEGLQVVEVLVEDAQGGRVSSDEAAAWHARIAPELTVLFDPQREAWRAWKADGTGFPLSYLVTREGEIGWRHFGGGDEAWLDDKVAPWL